MRMFLLSGGKPVSPPDPPSGDHEEGVGDGDGLVLTRERIVWL